MRKCTNSEALDGFIFWGAASTIGAAYWFGVSTTMFVATIVSVIRLRLQGEEWIYLLLRVIVANVSTRSLLLMPEP
jgi:hypothetical protein